MAQPLINITRKHALIFASFLLLYEFLTYIANDMIMPGMINVVASFNGPESAVATSLTAYMVGGASLQLFLGPISDRYGRRPVMIFGACLFFLCTVFITASNSIGQFLLARFFQGMGLCFISVVGYATLQEIFEEMDAIRLIAFMANISIIAPLLGPLLGAVFISYFNWRYIFVIIGSFALVALWGIWRFMPEPVGQIKRNGETIQRVSLSLRVIAANYVALLGNRMFMLSSIALGLIAVPCLAWIGLAPIILITEAKLSVIQYGWWQFPVFGAAIIGNLILMRLTHSRSAKGIVWVGAAIAVFSLLACFVLTVSMRSGYIGLMPGIILYFLGLGITSGPLTRIILFCTPVAKGTTSALMTLIAMCIQAAGIEVANRLYANHSNTTFGAFCAIAGILFIICLGGAFYFMQDKK